MRQGQANDAKFDHFGTFGAGTCCPLLDLAVQAQRLPRFNPPYAYATKGRYDS